MPLTNPTPPSLSQRVPIYRRIEEEIKKKELKI